MDDDRPGPFWLRDEVPSQAFRVVDGTFAALAGELVPTLSSTDAVLGPAADTIATVNDDGLATEYAATVGVAGDEVAAQAHADADQTAFNLVDSGGNVDQLRAGVLPHLPSVDTPIPIDFTEPPGPPPDQRGDDGGGDDKQKD